MGKKRNGRELRNYYKPPVSLWKTMNAKFYVLASAKICNLTEAF